MTFKLSLTELFWHATIPNLQQTADRVARGAGSAFRVVAGTESLDSAIKNFNSDIEPQPIDGDQLKADSSETRSARSGDLSSVNTFDCETLWLRTICCFSYLSRTRLKHFTLSFSLFWWFLMVCRCINYSCTNLSLSQNKFILLSDCTTFKWAQKIFLIFFSQAINIIYCLWLDTIASAKTRLEKGWIFQMSTFDQKNQIFSHTTFCRILQLKVKSCKLTSAKNCKAIDRRVCYWRSD